MQANYNSAHSDINQYFDSLDLDIEDTTDVDSYLDSLDFGEVELTHRPKRDRHLQTVDRPESHRTSHEESPQESRFTATTIPTIEQPAPRKANLKPEFLVFKQRITPQSFHLPAVACASASGFDRAMILDDTALERATDGVKQLAQQLKDVPLVSEEEFFAAYQTADPSPGSRQQWKPLISVISILSVLAGLGGLYHYRSACDANTLCTEMVQLWLSPPPNAAATQLVIANPQPKPLQSVHSASSSEIPSEAFRTAVNQAMAAAELTQTADSLDEWTEVAELWLDAIQLMNDVPASHSKHTIAVQKVEEYAKNLAYAQRKMRTATTPDAT